MNIDTKGTLIFRRKPERDAHGCQYELLLVEPALNMVRPLSDLHIGLLAVQLTQALANIMEQHHAVVSEGCLRSHQEGVDAETSGPLGEDS